MSGHVFISYSRTDRAYVERLAAHLGAAGIPFWVDHEIDHGDRWAAVIENQITACVAFVPVMTPEAAASEWVEREVHLAQQLGKPILPLLLSGRPFFRLATTQHDDVAGGVLPGARFLDRLRGYAGTQPAAEPTFDVSPAWGHDVGEVWSLAYSPTGRELVTGGADGEVRVWNTYSGTSLRTFAAPGGPVLDVAYSPGGNQIASGSQSGPVSIQDAYGGEVIRTLVGHEEHVGSLKYSPIGRTLATAGNDATARVWDISTGDCLVTFSDHESLLVAVTYSPDGQHIATASFDDTIRIWRAADGTPLRVLAQDGLLQDAVYSSGGRLATGGDDETIRIWDGVAGTLLMELDNGINGADSLGFSSDGRLLAAGAGWGEGVIRIWDAVGGRLLTTVDAHSGSVHEVAFSPDGRHLASASSDGFKVWRLGPPS